MKAQEHLFEDFSPTDKASWLAKVEKDLKGKPLSDLHWQLGEDLNVAPFYHPEDRPEPSPPLLAGREEGNDWEIGEYINVNETASANEQLLKGLNGGVEAPLFRLYHPLNADGLHKLLHSVKPEMVSLNFGEYYTGKQPARLFELLTAWAEEQGTASEKLSGSIDFDPLLDWNEPPVEELAGLIKTCAEQYPAFRPLQVNAKAFHSGPERVVEELAMTIAKGNEYLARLQEQGLQADTVNAHLQFGISISKSYFVEIAKLRAARLLWANVLKGYGISGQPARLIVHFAAESQDEQKNTNIIRASTQAMSAVIGGADRLYVLPSDHIDHRGYTEFSLRIARNLQHLLKMESHLHRVADPGAGSYYIEELTRQLCEKAWKRFQQLDAERVFA